MKKILLTAALVLIGTLAFAQERIAVFPFENLNNVLTQEESIFFYRQFSNEFTNRSAGRFIPVPRVDVEKLFQIEEAFQLNRLSSRAKTAEVESVLNGSQKLSGVIGKRGNSIAITISLYNFPDFGQLPGGVDRIVRNTDELFNIKPELVRSMQNEIVGREMERLIPVGLEFEIAGGGITITKYTGNAATVNIPSRILGLPVTVIGEKAFWRCDTLRNISIPSSVTIIGNEAFSGTNLTTVTIPPSVVSIGNMAFAESRNLTSVTIPQSVTSIGFSAFYMTSLTSVILPPSLTSIEAQLFAYCDKLVSVTIPSSVVSIGARAFYASGLTSVTIPPSVTSIDTTAFIGTDLINVSIPPSVTYIGNYAFSIDSLTDIVVDNHNPAYTSIDGVLFNKRIQALIQYPNGKQARTYDVPSSVTLIEGSAFGNKNLTSITIPSSVTDIGETAFVGTSLTSVTIPPSVTHIGNFAFSIDGLINIVVDNRNPAYTSIDGVLFDKTIQTLIQYPNGKQASTYIVPSSVTSIKDSAFSRSQNLTSVTIPSSVTYIGMSAFSGTNLTSVTIPPSVTSIENSVFSGCRNLTRITIPSSVISIGDYAFSNTGISSITIPSSVTSIGGLAFNECKNLTSVTLSRLTQVGYAAFPESVRIIYSD